MQIVPAIDLMNGNCVRLVKGDFASEVTYSDKPLEQLRRFSDVGAKEVHVVDLDAARGKGDNTQLIQSLAQSGCAKLQTGGGIRTLDDVGRRLASGAARVVLGSAVVSNPDLVREAIAQFGGDTIVLALDVNKVNRQFLLAVDGWREQTNVDLYETLDLFSSAGLRHVLITDISRDGAMSGANIDLYRDVVARYPVLDVQASGGVSGADDLSELEKADVSRAIVGKAIYEGQLVLEDLF